MSKIQHTIFFGIRHDDLTLIRTYDFTFAIGIPRAGEVLAMDEKHGITINTVIWNRADEGTVMYPQLKSYSGRDGMPPDYYRQFGYADAKESDDERT